MTTGRAMLTAAECAEIAAMIDHALLDPTLGRADLEAGCRLARDYGVASVCIVPWAVPLCAGILAGSTVRASTTIGFPHGANASATKLAEARRALADGATELDMVVNLSWVLDGAWRDVGDEIREIASATHDGGGKLKVIFENACLDDVAKIRLCTICGEAGADWVKTSTGFGPGGATEADVALMRRHTPAACGVKAAGGIRDLDTLLRFRALGADRCGASRTAGIVDEARGRAGLAPITKPDR
jgi:deoxyribose-phosphate aldolase